MKSNSARIYLEKEKEKMKNNELMKQTDMDLAQENVTDEDWETECSGGGKGLLVVGGLILSTIAGVTAYAWNKNKDKRKEKQIERLRNEGYVIFKESECEVREVEEEIVEEETTEE